MLCSTPHYGPAKVSHRDTTDAALRVVPLLEEASGLYGYTFCRGSWLHHVDVDFKQSFKSWYIIGFYRDMTNSDRCGRNSIRAPGFIPGIWGDRCVCRWSVYGVRIHLDPLSRFRGYVVFTCYLCWYQTLEGTIVVVNENQQITTD